MTASILRLFPELTNVNGDAENALVLARRAQWVGIDAEVVSLEAGEDAPSTPPTAIVLGSGVDSALERTRDALEIVSPALNEWLAQGVPLLAVGTGMELLSGSVESSAGSIEGLGLIPGRAVALSERAAGEIVVTSTWGDLVGYENHARGYEPDGSATLGAVRNGTGNADGTEGVIVGSIFGTHLHGPVLAKNPSFAIAVLAAGFGEDGDLYSPSRADGATEVIRAGILRRARSN